MANPTLSFFENLILGAITAAEVTVPIFLHSPNAIAVFNATEPIFNGAINNAIASQQPVGVATAPAAPAAS